MGEWDEEVEKSKEKQGHLKKICLRGHSRQGSEFWLFFTGWLVAGNIESRT